MEPRVLQSFLKIIPKVGPFKAVAFKIPSKPTEDLYVKSVDKTVDDYTTLLREQRDENLRLANLDCDTGRDTQGGEYSLADKTHAHLLDDLAKHNFNHMSIDLRGNILVFFASPDVSLATGKDVPAQSSW